MIIIPKEPRKIVGVIEFAVLLWAKTYTRLLPFILFFTVICASYQLYFQFLETELKRSPNAAATPVAAGSWMANFVPPQAPFSILCIIAFVLGVILLLASSTGMIYHMNALARQQNPTFAHSFWMGLKKVFPYLFAYILYGMLVMLGLVFLIIPGLYLMLVLMFAPYLVAINEAGIIAAFKESYRIASGNWWRIFWTLILGSILMTIFLMIILLPLGLAMALLQEVVVGGTVTNSQPLHWVSAILIFIIDFAYISIALPLTFSLALSMIYNLQARWLKSSGIRK